MNIYDVAIEMRTWIASYNEAETDEQLALVEQQLNALQMQFDQKAIGVAKFILNTEADSSAIDAEIERLQALKKRSDRQSERMRAYLKSAMEATNTTEVDGTILKLKIKKNPPRVEIEDEKAVPKEYIKTKVIETVDKEAIKLAVKAGVGVAGTKVVQGTRLEIK